MPELPEVETIKNQLSRKLKGKRIKKTIVILFKIIQAKSKKFFIEKTEGARIKKVWRRAKMIIIDLDNDYSLVVHLKLSGQLFFYLNEEEDYGKYTHLIFHFFDKSVLIFKDLRQFGYFNLCQNKNLEKFFQDKKLGPEPLAKNFTPHLFQEKKDKCSSASVGKGAGFTLNKFKELLAKKKKTRIKPLLMDQSFIAGVGNIYAQEVCWCAKILPARVVGTLKDREIKELYCCLIKILKQAIRQKGTTAADDKYLDVQGEKGGYASELKVYQRENQKCFRCRGKIKRIVLAGRGTSYCPVCQK